MAAPSLWVRREFQLEAARLLKGGSVREAMEMLLNHDLSFEDNGLNIDDKVDAGIWNFVVLCPLNYNV